MSSREWDAASYHRISEPQLAWAREQLERLELSGEETRTFVSTVCLVRHLDPLPPRLHAPFIERVLGCVGQPLVLDYVRLNMSARRT